MKFFTAVYFLYCILYSLIDTHLCMKIKNNQFILKKEEEKDDLFEILNVEKDLKLENNSFIRNKDTEKGDLSDVFYYNFLTNIKNSEAEYEKLLEKSDKLIKQVNENNMKIEEKNKLNNKTELEIKKSIKKIENYHQKFLDEFNSFEVNYKKKNLREVRNDYKNSMIFYNSLSLIMLALLSGGLVGIMLILFFSFTKNSKF